MSERPGVNRAGSAGALADRIMCPLCFVTVEAFPWGDDGWKLSPHRAHSVYHRLGLVALEACCWCHGSSRIAQGWTVAT